MSLWGQLSFQNANSSIMENMIMFHDYIMMIILMIIMLIIYMILYIFMNKILNRYILENQFMEIIWTIIPMIILFFLAIPSLKILYLSDEINNSLISIKVIGHQWYWSYEYIDFYDINFDSFMINDFTNLMNFRLLDVDNHLIVPMNNYLKFLINSSDVIHSFTIPSLGLKVDAIPGRINQISIMLNRSGLYYGQCSEICGINHSFMPIVLESINLIKFLNWIKNFN